jgi:hypothetical protein
MVRVDGIGLLPEAGEAGEGVIKLSSTGTGEFPAGRFTRPLPPLSTPCIEELIRQGCAGVMRMDWSIAPRQASPEKTHLPLH